MTSFLAIFRKPALRKAAVAFFGGGAVLLLTSIPSVRLLVRKADRAVSDAIIRTTSNTREHPELVLLGIDDASQSGSDLDPAVIAADPLLQQMTKRFPWDRHVWAAAIDRLSDAGARLIAIDLVLSEESTPEADQALSEAIARHRDKVVLASAFSPAAANEVGQDKFTLTEPLADFFGPGPVDTRCGFVNFSEDDDGLIRFVRYQTTKNQMNGAQVHPDEEVIRSFAGEILAALGKPMPAGDFQMRMALGAGDSAAEVYAPKSIRSIFVPDDWKRNFDEGRFFKNKIVLIGPTAPRFQDNHATIGGAITGPQLHLQALTCGLDDAFVSHSDGSGLLAMGFCLAASLLAAAWCFLVKRPSWSALGAAALLVGLFVTAGIIGAWIRWVPPVILAGLGFFVAWIASQSFELITERLERGRLNREFRRFVSRDVADFLVRNPETYKSVASGRRRRVVVLFSDVRGFTSRSEHTEPAELVRQLNEYLTRMVSIVFQHQGTLDKFIGDAVMAHWGALEDGSESDHARQAVGAALDMITGLAELNAKWAAEGRDPFEIGIGLHLGDVLAGEIGSVDKIEFGVIGDAVNLASRIEGLTKYFGVQLLVSDAVAHQVEQQAGLRNVGRVRVKGRVEPVDLHAPSRGESLDQQFHAAQLLFMAGDFPAAAAAFKAYHQLDPEDGAAKRLWKWSGEYAASPPPDWDGTVIMDSK